MITALLALTCVSLLCYLISVRKAKLRIFATMGVKGPEPNLLFGNLHEFAHKKSFEAYASWTRQYGSTYGVYEGSSPVLVTSDLEILREVYIKKFNSFYGRRLFPIQPEPDTGADKDVHILFSRGLRWKRLRTTISPSFSTAKIKQMLPLINACIDQLIDAVEEKCKSGASFDIHRLIQGMTMNVIASCAFGLSPSFQENESDPFIRRCRRLFDDFARKPWILILGALFPEFRNFWWHVCKLISAYTYDDMEWLFNNLGAVIEARRAATSSGKGGNRVDLLQLLLDAEVCGGSGGSSANASSRGNTLSHLTMTDTDDSLACNGGNADDAVFASSRATAESPSSCLKALMDGVCCRTGCPDKSQAAATARCETQNRKKLTMDEVKANSVVFLVGGYETVSNLIAYVAYEMAIHADCQKRLQEELDAQLSSDNEFTYENVTQLRYLEMVVRETLRMYPMGSLITGRMCMKSTIVHDMRIPEGMTVQPDVWSLHREEKHWGENPDQFNPERFLPEAVAARDPMAYMPFGAGPKNCVGMRFALTECKFTVARLFSKYTLLATSQTNVELTDGAALNPKNGVILKAVERNYDTLLTTLVHR